MTTAQVLGFSPYWLDSATGTTSQPEKCVVSFFEGSDLEADFVHFLPDQATVEVQATGATANHHLDFGRIRLIRFTEPVDLVENTEHLRDRGIDVPAMQRKAPFSIDFRDGRVLIGELFGYGAMPGGLGIYMVNQDERAIRCFLPASAVKNFTVGEQLGKLLIEQDQLTENGLQAALDVQRNLRSQRLGDLLVDKRIVNPQQLDAAIQAQAGLPVRRLGEVLVDMEVITEQQLKAALEEQKKHRGTPLGELLIEMGLLDRETWRVVLAQKLGIPHVALDKFKIDDEAFKSVPRSTLFKHRVVPLYRSGGSLIVAMEDPLNNATVDALRFSAQMNIIPVLATREDIDSALQRGPAAENVVLWDAEGVGETVSWPAETAGNANKFNSNLALADELTSQLTLEGGFGDAETNEAVVMDTDNTLVKLVNKIILDAHQDGVSDIHIEPRPGKENVRVRFRRDGALYDYLEIPSPFRSALLGRIKVMANLDISERRKPQDGKIDFKRFGPAQIELRVATIPISNNLESVVMRILTSAKPMPVNKLRLAPRVFEDLLALVEKPYGLVIVCGPTGSGKTTTLHSLMGHINTVERKIWTAEDPIEITQPGLNQVQVNPKIGWTFAAALRAFLRADPDVIMVGEMRDSETAHIGVEASLTGHLVLSTLHTNSAPESVTRLLDLGLDPFTLADALLGVLAQRLARQLCVECKKPASADEAQLAALAEEYCFGSEREPADVVKEWRDAYAAGGDIKLAVPQGCTSCSDTGYRGRIAVHELLVVTPAIKQLIRTRAPVSDTQSAALRETMRTLKQDGIDKVLQGLTTIEQVRAVCT